jgi:parallel beta helix pectate lyase-like protein
MSSRTTVFGAPISPIPRTSLQVSSSPRPRRRAGLIAVATAAIAALGAGCGQVAHVDVVSPSRTVTVPASIDASGATDVTNALQTFISKTPNGSTVVFPPGAQYRIEGTVHVMHRDNLAFEGTGAKVFATTRGDRERSQFLVRDSANIKFHGLEVVGAHPDGGMDDSSYDSELEAQHAFQLEGVRNLELDAVKAHDVYGDFVYITRDNVTRTWSDGVWVHDSTFARNGRMGIAITAGRHVVIERNSISDTRRSTIDLEPSASSGGAEYVRIDSNRIYRGRLNFVSAGKSLSTRTNDIHDITITRNVLKGHILNVMVATRETYNQRRANFTVVGNTSDTPAYGTPPLRFWYVDGVRVQNNRQPTKLKPVTIAYCTDAVVSGNFFSLS